MATHNPKWWDGLLLIQKMWRDGYWFEQYLETLFFNQTWMKAENASIFPQTPEKHNFKPIKIHNFYFWVSKILWIIDSSFATKQHFKNIVTFPKFCYKMLKWDILMCQNTFSSFLLEMNYSKIDVISCVCFKGNAQMVYGSGEWFCLSLWIDLINTTSLSLALLICSFKTSCSLIIIDQLNQQDITTL